MGKMNHGLQLFRCIRVSFHPALGEGHRNPVSLPGVGMGFLPALCRDPVTFLPVGSGYNAQHIILAVAECPVRAVMF